MTKSLIRSLIVALGLAGAVLGSVWLTPEAPGIGPAVQWFTPTLVGTTGNVMPDPRPQFLDNNGAILGGGKLCFYAAGTTTPQTPSSTANMLTPTTNPVVLDSAGRIPSNVYLGPLSYKLIMYAAASTTTDCTTGTFLPTSAGYWTADNVQGAAGTDASVLGGNLPWAQLPSGSGTWTGTPTISGALTLSFAGTSLAVTGAATFGATGLIADTTGVLRSSVQARVDAFNTGTQSVPDTTLTALTLNTERFNVGGMHSTSVNTSHLVVPLGQAGVYWIYGWTAVAANATGRRRLVLRKNGVTTLNDETLASPTAANQSGLQVGALAQLAQNDYVEMLTQQTSGGNLNYGDTGTTDGDETEVTMVRLW